MSAVGSPSFFAIRPCEYSWTVSERTIIGSERRNWMRYDFMSPPEVRYLNIYTSLMCSVSSVPDPEFLGEQTPQDVAALSRL